MPRAKWSHWTRPTRRRLRYCLCWVLNCPTLCFSSWPKVCRLLFEFVTSFSFWFWFDSDLSSRSVFFCLFRFLGSCFVSALTVCLGGIRPGILSALVSGRIVDACPWADSGMYRCDYASLKTKRSDAKTRTESVALGCCWAICCRCARARWATSSPVCTRTQLPRSCRMLLACSAGECCPCRVVVP